jgi:hypothetical protein
MIDLLSGSTAALSTLTASTNLCSLQLGIDGWRDQQSGLFRPGTIYQHLRLIDLRHGGAHMALSEQQLQQLCSCCPMADSLAFALGEKASTAALLPLLQLTQLTHLSACIHK